MVIFMKKLMIWILCAVVLMIGFPWLAVSFAGSAGMAVCFILFFAINPLFAIACGVFAGSNIKKLWALPILVAGLFLLGVWLFFEMGEMAFLWYAGCYLVIGMIAMVLRALALGEQYR